MRKISLGGKCGKGKFALVSDEDYNSVKKYPWRASKCCTHKNCKNFYVITSTYEKGTRKRGIIRLHRFILKAKPNELVDHKDGDGLNCQRNNIRKCNAYQNAQNKRSSVVSKSEYIGVFKDGVSFRASIRANRQQISLGFYKTKNEAALIYNIAAILLHGEFAKTNKIKGKIAIQGKYISKRKNKSISFYEYKTINKDRNGHSGKGIYVVKIKDRQIGRFIKESDAIKARNKEYKKLNIKL